MKKIYDFLKNEINLLDKDVIVIGCSGGPDSMALLHLFTKFKTPDLTPEKLILWR